MERNEIQELLIEKFGKDVYFQKMHPLKEDIVIYGVKLSADDFMDNAGEININDLKN